jgi:AcrR family transcriptional regulator
MAEQRQVARLSDRATEIVAAARTLLEEEGVDGLRMRTLAERLGIKAPSLYAHFRDKRDLENAMIVAGFLEREASERAAVAATPDVEEIVVLWRAYRDWAMAHPALHRLIASRALDRDDPSVVAAERPGIDMVLKATNGNATAGLAYWAFAHGLIELELNDRVPPGQDLDAVWAFGLAALGAAVRAG